MLMHILGVGVGLTFSGGLIDLVLFGIMQGNAKTSWLWIPVVGAVYFLLYFFTFYFLIKKFDFETPGCVSFFELEPNKFLVIGMEGSLEVKCKPNEAKKASFLRLESGTVEEGSWIPDRNLNGDERMAIKFGSMPTAYMLELYKY